MPGRVKERVTQFDVDTLARECAIPANRRLALHCIDQATTAADLISAMATIPEVLELCVATGLVFNQVMYLAQMVRTLSLLLRACRLRGFVLGGALEPANLVRVVRGTGIRKPYPPLSS